MVSKSLNVEFTFIYILLNPDFDDKLLRLYTVYCILYAYGCIKQGKLKCSKYEILRPNSIIADGGMRTIASRREKKIPVY